MEHVRLVEINSENMFLGCMIDWSRFAGSLWDSLLAGRVSTDSLVDKVGTFDAAICDFMDNTFRVAKMEFHQPQLDPFIRMSFDNLRLLAQGTILMSLGFDGHTIHDCSKSAMNSLAHVQAFEAATRVSSACTLRHYMIPSLAGSLVVLSSILVGDLYELNLALDLWLPEVRKTFDAVVSLLHDLAQGLPLARRVLRDFELVTSIVQAAFTRWSAETQLVPGPLGWDIVKDVIPANVMELFPYRDQVPDIGPAATSDELSAAAGIGLSPRADPGFASWSHVSGGGAGAAKSGVLWI